MKYAGSYTQRDHAEGKAALNRIVKTVSKKKMKFTGSYTQRERAERQAALNCIIKTASKIDNAADMQHLLLVIQQIQHTCSGKYSRAELWRSYIFSFALYNDDINELERMYNMIVYISRTKQRQAERAAKQSKETA